MSDKFVMSVRQAAELDHAFERNGWLPEEVKELSKGTLLGEIRDIIRGYNRIVRVQHIIDCDAAPFVPDGWKVGPENQLSGAVRGQLVWDPAKVQLFLSDRQKSGTISGHDLCKELTDKPVLNANVLDYLLAHTELIPEEWKQDEQGRTRYIFFWGTIYRGPGGYLCVRCLDWCGGRWQWDWDWFENDWSVQYPSALLASF